MSQQRRTVDTLLRCWYLRRLLLQLPRRMSFQLQNKDRIVEHFCNKIMWIWKYNSKVPKKVDVLAFTARAVQHGIVPFRQMVGPMLGHVTDRQRQFLFGRNFVRNCPDWTEIQCINALSPHIGNTVEVQGFHRKNVRNPLQQLLQDRIRSGIIGWWSGNSFIQCRLSVRSTADPPPSQREGNHCRNDSTEKKPLLQQQAIRVDGVRKQRWRHNVLQQQVGQDICLLRPRLGHFLSAEWETSQVRLY